MTERYVLAYSVVPTAPQCRASPIKTSGNPNQVTGSRKILFYFIVLLTGSGSKCGAQVFVTIFKKTLDKQGKMCGLFANCG